MFEKEQEEDKKVWYEQVIFTEEGSDKYMGEAYITREDKELMPSEIAKKYGNEGARVTFTKRYKKM